MMQSQNDFAADYEPRDAILETNDHGPESESMYDSDMAAYIGKGNPEVEKSITIMNAWAAEGN